MSWYPPAYSDGQIQSNPGFSDSTLTSLLDIAHEHGIKGAALCHTFHHSSLNMLLLTCACSCAVLRAVHVRVLVRVK